MNNFPHDRSLSTAADAAQRPERIANATVNRAGTLSTMSVPQLREALVGLDTLETQYENMSGVAATMKGVLLLEAKKRLGHGHFMPFVRETFPAKHKTANRYMRLAEAFTAGSKFDSTVQFAELGRGLLESAAALREFQLDLSHPVVAKVAEWVAGRGAYQLMLDFPGERGGDTSTSRRKKLTPAEEHKQFLEDCKDDFCGAVDGFDRINNQEIWKASSVSDAMLESAVEVAADFAKRARAWLAVPRRERAFKQAAAQ